MYAALWCKSNFSFLEGASHPAELVEAAARLGLDAIALTDRDGVYGIVRAHLAAQEHGIKLIVGAQVTIEDGSRILVLAMDRAGYANMCRLLSKGRLRCAKGESRVSWAEVCQHAQGLIALWGGEGSLLVAKAPPDRVAAELKLAFGDRLYALLTRHLLAEEVAPEARLRERAERYGIPVVAGTEVLYHTLGRKPLQDVVTCIRHGVTLSAAGRKLKPNAEHFLMPPMAFEQRFGADHAAVARTREVAARCTFSLADIRYRYPSEWLPEGITSAQRLRKLAYEGVAWRYPEGVPEGVPPQLERELELIEKLDYCGYFLTMYELVQFCKREDILCQGRGSAANSIVCFCLGVTAVDPVRMDLLFERFLSEERAEPPDIDLDIEHDRREEVIQHMYAKYGRDRAAMVAVVICYRSRSVARDVGRVLGMTETDLGRLGKLLGYHGGGLKAETLQLEGFDPELEVFQQLLTLGRELIDFPRHLSIHPGGFLLGHEPVHDLVPIENGTMADRTVIQWDKDDVEALGLFKVDLLGLGALNQLHRCFNLLREHYDRDWDMATVPKEDPATYKMLHKADVVGVFQVESRAQMSMLPRLKPVNYYDLVIEISLVRPGPITGGMVHPYLRRRAGKEEPVYPHPKLIPILQKTLGVPLFQEQVMKLAMVAADYTPGEADQLRRDMAAWRKQGKLEGHRDRLVERMKSNGIEQEFAERVFKQIQGFGEYGFPEAHAASFALITYVGAYLRCHYLAAFTASLLNALPMGFYSASTIVEDAKRHGVEVRPMDIRVSQWGCTLEPLGEEFAIRIGLCLVKGLGAADWAKIAAAAVAPFTSIEDVVWRTDLDEGALVALAEAGALDGLAVSRRQALWEVRGLARSEHVPLPVDLEDKPLFRTLSLFETINWDYERSDHSARGHPLGPLRPLLKARGLPDARELTTFKHGQRVRYAGIVICRQRPGTAAGVVFMTLEDESGFVNLVVWPDVFTKNVRIIKVEPFLGVSGKLQVQEGVVHLIAERFWKPDLDLTPSHGASRDFH
ncbi:MAG: dnaE [Cyanobacteria bacterium RYN_339]|nr:dnaE [Cyanobacteria bacterium RYN_339]